MASFTTSSNFTCPPFSFVPTIYTSILTTTTVSALSFKGTSMSFILACVQIHAPASLIAGVILNNIEWPQWNTFIPRCEATPSLTSVKPTSRSSSLMPGVPGIGKNQRLLSVGDAMTFYVMSGSREEDMGGIWRARGARGLRS